VVVPDVIAHAQGDTVGVAVRGVVAGEQVMCFSDADGSSSSVSVTADLPLGHKVALVEMAEGGQVVKYGLVVGVATSRIRVGEHVHTHNVRSARWPGK